MRYLLDTHALLWARAAPALLSEEARIVFESNDTTLYVSMATLWECAIKRSIGKLELPDNFFEIIADDYEVLGIEISLLWHTPSWPCTIEIRSTDCWSCKPSLAI